MKAMKIWHVVLGILLIFWGAILMDWVTFSNSSDVLGIGSIVTGVLALIDK